MAFEELDHRQEADAQADAYRKALGIEAAEESQAEQGRLRTLASSVVPKGREIAQNVLQRRILVRAGAAVTALGVVGGAVGVLSMQGGGEESGVAVDTTIEDEAMGLEITEAMAEPGTTSTSTTTSLAVTTTLAPTTTTIAPEVRSLLKPAAENYDGLDCVNPFVIQADTWFDPIARYCGAVRGFEPADMYSWNGHVCDFSKIPLGVEIFFEEGQAEDGDCPPPVVTVVSQSQQAVSEVQVAHNEDTESRFDCPNVIDDRLSFIKGPNWTVWEYLDFLGYDEVSAARLVPEIEARYNPGAVGVGDRLHLPTRDALNCTPWVLQTLGVE